MKIVNPNEFTDLVCDSDDEALDPQSEELYRYLTNHVIGQERAARRVALALALHNSGQKDPTIPIFAGLLAGTTGTGKTMTAEETARCIILNRAKAPLTRVPCTKLTERHDISVLTGSAPGYVGHGDLAALTQLTIDGPHLRARADARIREIGREFKKPEERNSALLQLHEQECETNGPLYSVILFDEIEKAHEAIWNLLLNIIQDGELAMNDGSTTDFSHTFLFMTCNVGGKEQQGRLKKKRRIGYDTGVRSQNAQAAELDDDLYRITKERIEDRFPSEFIGRIEDEIIVFRPPTPADVRRALDKASEIVQERLDAKFRADPPEICFSERYVEFLVKKGHNQRYGMRPMKHAVKRYCSRLVATALNKRQLRSGDRILFDVVGGKAVLRRAKRQPAIKLDSQPLPAPPPPVLLPKPTTPPATTPRPPALPPPPARPPLSLPPIPPPKDPSPK